MKPTIGLAFCAMVALLSYSISQSTPAKSAPTQPRAGTPLPAFPEASHLVCRDGVLTLNAQKQTYPVYKVPADKWFVLTDVRIQPDRNSSWPGIVQRKDGKDEERIGGTFLQHERKRTNTSYRYYGPYLGDPRVGVAFAPKSLVAVSRNGRTGRYAYHIRGYLTDR